MQVRNTLRKFGTVLGASAVIGATSIGQAYADAAAAATKITGAEADVETIGYAALGLVVVAALFKYMRRAV
ncbi:major capsid protein [Pseudomonas sp. F(2018)]|uniref:major capsid protein n=1 Tax=Pseudomonas sp. F(2018) TaxID=2502240 RepID=UPI0010F95DC7|nr:major capsid protein [Pseudomonas sp. F(2018)]